MKIMSIDPGTTQSGVVIYERKKILWSGILDNNAVGLAILNFDGDQLAIEMVASYGMAVGKETFRTVWWAGRFAQVWFAQTGDLPMEIFRKDVKVLLCGSAKAKDGNIRQALIDYLGPQGTKKDPGPTYGMKTHLWSALAVAVTADLWETWQSLERVNEASFLQLCGRDEVANAA